MNATLVPQPLASLLGRARAELASRKSVFDLPRRSFWQPAAGLDLGVTLAGGRVQTPLGPAAGPHTQLAPNIALAWLAGARAIELKTVQVKDRLEIPRPCIDAPDEAYNVEWSQELSLEQSAEQYVVAWMLVHALAAMGLAGEVATPGARFEASVGYDLAGLRSDRVARFLDTMTDAGAAIAEQLERLPAALRAVMPDGIPRRIVDGVTLSTFHGCPPEEIERMVEHLFERHGLHVVVKLNPTLLGHDAVEDLLRGRMGYGHLALDRDAFAIDLGWERALEMFERLEDTARGHGLALGVKFTNTLIVRNARGRLAGERVYLSGPPLHPIAVGLAARFARATSGRIPLSFSGGVDPGNFADVVACGLAPVTTCTDLLKPTGYRRLPMYLKSLGEAMEAVGATTIGEFVKQIDERHGPEPAGPAVAPGPAGLSPAALRNLERYAAAVPDDPRYHAEARTPAPAQAGRLSWFDCASCNACVVVCPNDAFFSLALGPLAIETRELVIEAGHVVARPARFELTREKQWALFADACNACGNCDTHCPEAGGPYRAKPRFHGARADFEAAAPDDGILIEDHGRAIEARLGGARYRAAWLDGGARFTDGVIEARLDAAHEVVEARALERREGHVLPLERFHALRLLRDAVLAGANGVSAAVFGDEAP